MKSPNKIPINLNCIDKNIFLCVLQKKVHTRVSKLPFSFLDDDAPFVSLVPVLLISNYEFTQKKERKSHEKSDKIIKFFQL